MKETAAPQKVSATQLKQMQTPGHQAVKGWFVLRAISGKEHKVKEVLEAQMRNTDLGNYLYQVLIPSEKVLTVRNGKKVVKERNLYSGYVFVEALLTGDVAHLLANTTNVIDFLRGRDKGSAPEVLREADVKRMLGQVDEMNEDLLDDSANDFMVGESVKVIAGAFAGFIGEIEEVNREKKKLKVMVKVFGRKTPLELENSQVERELKSDEG